MYDIIIIGAGPAGLSASIYAKRSNKNVLVFESSHPGGQIVNALKINNYPAISEISGYDFATNLYNQTKSLGVEFKFESVLNIKNYDIPYCWTRKSYTAQGGATYRQRLPQSATADCRHV